MKLEKLYATTALSGFDLLAHARQTRRNTAVTQQRSRPIRSASPINAATSLATTLSLALFALPTVLLAQAPAGQSASAPASVQQGSPRSPASGGIDADMEVVVVRGSRLPESVPGDVKPELAIGTFEIRTTGATTLPELLATLLPQTQSGRRRGGNRPILLVNARRVADFSEIRAIPVRAIRRVEIYPEDVALRYGFPADQKVVNLILVGQFSIIGVTGGLGLSAEGERDNYSLALDGTRISTAGRSTFSLEASQSTAVTEEDLGVSLSPGGVPGVRTLLPEATNLRVSGALGRSLEGLGEQGYGTIGVDIVQNTTDAVLGRTGAGRDLVRDTSLSTAKLSLTAEAIRKDLRRSSIFLLQSEDQQTRTDRTDGGLDDEADQNQIGASFDGNLAGPLPGLAAGPGAFNLNIQLANNTLESSFRRGLVVGDSDIERTRSAVSGSLSLPLASRRRTNSALGDVSLTLNAGVSDTSDFGGSALWGAGVNWSPRSELTLTARYDETEELPTLVQLGAPLSNLPSASVYDARTGTSLRLDVVTGGNLDLLEEKRRDVTIGATFAPLQVEGLNLSATYARNETENFIGSIGVNTRATEAAFPSLYTRNGSEALIGVDSRPLNLGDRTTQTLSLGLSFTRNFGQAPKFLRDVVERVRKAQDENPDAPLGPGGLPPGLTPPPGFKPPPGGTPPDFNQIMQAAKIPGGRWNIGLNYAYTLDDTLRLSRTGETLDLLEGGAFDTSLGARHEVTFDGGINYRGLGGRLAAKWRGDSEIATGYGADRLFVDDQITLDLALFASTDLMPQLNMAVPILPGAQIRFEVTNLTDSVQDVTNSAGLTPTAFQSQLIDPAGRAFKLSIKKQF
jgi:TonB dependent receptor